ncbi:hypothetical protein TNCV_4661421 [Trichonephila clavipes]|uniref:Uncharacterized protein n=1 Tax=Trichonephila clavipes TaxID=2585209 RepID=A0A8X6SCP4_TRICX|nr:hypothetical protein TNCV_4661421 [Trichonephila clavipes]
MPDPSLSSLRTSESRWPNGHGQELTARSPEILTLTWCESLESRMPAQVPPSSFDRGSKRRDLSPMGIANGERDPIATIGIDPVIPITRSV